MVRADPLRQLGQGGGLLLLHADAGQPEVARVGGQVGLRLGQHRRDRPQPRAEGRDVRGRQRECHAPGLDACPAKVEPSFEGVSLCSGTSTA